VGGFLVFAIQKIFKYYQEKNAPFSGYWESQLYDESGKEIIKQDVFCLRQNGDFIEGEVKRFVPEDQNFKKWKLYGKKRDKNFFAIFWNRDKNIHSYGCWFLRVKDENSKIYEGYYLKYIENDIQKEIKPIRMDFIKSKQRK
jgi:hypothetical protein